MANNVEQKKGPSEFSVFLSWCRDKNLNSPIPDSLVNSKAIGVPFLLSFFLPSSNYFCYINKTFNNWDALKLKNVDVMRTFKEIIYYTNYNAFSPKKAQPKENPLIKVLREKFPYYKKEEIIMAVNIIDNSEDKDVIYEMFGINDKVKVKKLTAKDKKDRSKKLQSVSNGDVFDLL